MLRRRPRTVRCLQCKLGVKVKSRGPIPRYCSGSCRQTAHLRRRNISPMTLLAEDLATERVRGVIREEVWGSAPPARACSKVPSSGAKAAQAKTKVSGCGAQRGLKPARWNGRTSA